MNLYHRLLLILINLVFVHVVRAQDYISNDPDISWLENSETTTQVEQEFSEQRIYSLRNKIKISKESQDTSRLIHHLSELGYVYSHRANFAKSYENLWQALLLAHQRTDTTQISNLHTRIAWLYRYFLREKESHQYMQSALDLKRKLIKQKKIKSKDLISVYYALTIFYRYDKKYTLAKQYLDSCYLLKYQDSTFNDNFIYLRAEQAYYSFNQGQVDLALTKMHELVPEFKRNQATYLTILFTTMADAYKQKLDYARSERYYKAAIQISLRLNCHTNYLPLVYEKLAELYKKTRRFELAYSALQKAKINSEALFDSRSTNNSPLLEITDLYQKSQQKEIQLVQSQRLLELEQQDKIGKLQITILLISLVFFLIMGYLHIRSIRNRHQAEKQLERQKQELERQKDSELIDMKNKELTTSALRLIEKDEFFEAIKEHLKSNKQSISDPNLKRLIRNATTDSQKNWSEFESRFIEVNQSFYDELSKLAPSLSAGDRKLCALIKLDFSSKEIAQLLGISVESVHKHRYRLRKKLGLERVENLTDYLQKLT